jgi:hypothetical protein
MVLEDAAWIADDGVRFADLLRNGINAATEIEPFPDGEVLIGLTSIIDTSVWMHALPRVAQ